MKKTKALSLVMAVIVFVTVLFCYQYMIQNAHHNCSGEDCPVCMELAMVAHTLSELKLIPILPFTMAVLSVFTLMYTNAKAILCVQHTLITLKVELLD